MKFKALLKKLSIVFIIICVVATSVFCVYAVEETVAEPDVTQAEEYTEPVVEETDPPVEPETEETTEEVTEETTEETTESTTESTEATQETTEQTDSAEEETQETEQRKTLPTMAKEEKETVKPDKNDLTYGYVSWTCVVAGVLVLAIVLISTKRK